MIPQVFLSLSGEDDQFVEGVWRHLPEGLGLFYRQSFQNGQKLLDAMASGVEHASVFVFFASEAAIRSRWVGFEIDQARFATIRRPQLKILVFPLSPNVSPSMLPSWMQQYWIPKAGWQPKDIARYIRTVVTSPPICFAGIFDSDNWSRRISGPCHTAMDGSTFRGESFTECARLFRNCRHRKTNVCSLFPESRDAYAPESLVRTAALSPSICRCS